MSWPDFYANSVQGLEDAESGPEVFYHQKELLKTAGWVVKSSSDGTTLNSTGDSITSGLSGAGGMNNDNAWLRIQSPDGAREFVWQCITAFTGSWRASFRVKYIVGNFSGGTATQVPSGTSEQVIKGSGTDAAPAGTGWYHSNTGDVDGKFMGVCETVYPYRFWSNSVRASSAGEGSVWCFDAVDGLASDDEPFVIAIGDAVTTLGFSLVALSSYTGNTKFYTYWDFGGANEAFNQVVLSKWFASTINLDVNLNGKADLLPLLYAREDGKPSPGGVKGYSTLIMGIMLSLTAARRKLYVTSDKNLVSRSNAALPWPDGGAIDTGDGPWPSVDAQFSIPGGYESVVIEDTPARPEDANDVPKSLLDSGSSVAGFTVRETSERLF